MTRYYLDTSIWLDYYEKRGKNGEIALELIEWIIENNFIIVYSDLHIKEFKRLGYSFNEINNILRIAKPKNIRVVHINKNQRIESRKLVSIKLTPFNDILHSIIARDNEAIIVTRDKDFNILKDIVVAKNPEELI